MHVFQPREENRRQLAEEAQTGAGLLPLEWPERPDFWHFTSQNIQRVLFRCCISDPLFTPRKLPTPDFNKGAGIGPTGKEYKEAAGHERHEERIAFQPFIRLL